jgi:membrane-associated phospholipid phosphatase
VPRTVARALLLWLVALAATAASVAVSYRWVDQPIAFFVHMHLRHVHLAFLGLLARVPDPLIAAASVLLIFEAFRILRRLPLTIHHRIASACGLSILVAEAIKDQLKFVFGRSWPTSGDYHRPSLIGDGTYGFHWLHGGNVYQSFPSGHMGAACALLSVLWLYYPRGRPLWAAAALVIGAALIGGNYHFLGDVIAGAFVGCSVGLATTRILRDWVSGKT